MLAGRAKHHLDALAGLRPREFLPYVFEKLEKLFRHFRTRRGAPPSFAYPGAHDDLPAEIKRFREASKTAWSRYRPRYYDGELMFVQEVPPASAESIFRTNVVSMWARLARRLKVAEVAAEHGSLGAMESHRIASRISDHLRAIAEPALGAGLN
jgi:hypothetical protein